MTNVFADEPYTPTPSSLQTIEGFEFFPLVFDRDGRAFPEWTAAGAYEVIP